MMFGGMFWVWILIIAGLIWFFKYAIDSNRLPHQQNRHAKNALDILKQRYARGEIDKAEFEQMKNDLIS